MLDGAWMASLAGLAGLVACGALAGCAGSPTTDASAPGQSRAEPPADDTSPEAPEREARPSSSDGDRFELVAMQLEGKPLDLGARETVRVIDFWASWCEPCVRQIPEIVALQERYADRDVEVFIVSVDRGRAELDEVLAEHDFGDVTVLWDPAGRASNPDIKFFIGVSVPRTLVVDAEGRIVARHRGSDDPLKDLSEDLDALLGEAQEQTDGP